jgi:hypothetical protein
MTLNDLLEQLQDLLAGDESLGDAEVLLATQPNYPLAHEVRCLTLDRCTDGKPLVWLAEGGHPDASPYAPKHAWSGDEVYADADE